MSVKDEDLDKFAQQLQNQIMEQIKKRYSEVVIDHWQNPRNFQKMENPDGYAQVKGTCGDSMEMFIKMKNQTITECTFQTDGCGTTIACGSTATELAKNKNFTQVLAQVSTEAILKNLKGLPQEDVHCAQLASDTLRRALADYLSQKKSPWKKHYRKI
ncbi:iron-sulfur cluster assembly scaffold protein [bacterium]|nr:iron-sulfur cluster assembly scaffold protein [bacterium]